MALSARRMFLADMLYEVRDIVKSLAKATEDEWIVAELERIIPPREIPEEYRDSAKKKEDEEQIFHRLLK